VGIFQLTDSKYLLKPYHVANGMNSMCWVIVSGYVPPTVKTSLNRPHSSQYCRMWTCIFCDELIKTDLRNCLKTPTFDCL